MPKTPIILASSSTYRKQLLQKLHLPFTCISPNIDETIHPDETAMDAVARLSREKAEAIGKLHQQAVIISSDQVACLGNTILGKPETRENAIHQLGLCSGNKVTFLTGLCLLNSQNHNLQLHIEPFSVYFRQLSLNDIERYIAIDQPLDCAGSFKAESLGIALFEKMEGNDPNSLIGLPLIQLVSFLKNEGISVLDPEAGT